jgi:hypothetical protein
MIIEPGRIMSEEESAMHTQKLLNSTALSAQIGGDHYKNFAIQPAVFIERNKIPFLDGCVIKRMCRHEAKNGVEDLRKAIHEIELIIELRYGN